MVRGDERGAGAVEYAGLVVLAALILGGLVAGVAPGRVSAGLRRTICAVFHPGQSSGQCASTGGRRRASGRPDAYKPRQACTVRSSSTRYGGHVTVLSVDIGHGVQLVEQTDSQGHVTVTAVGDRSVKATAGVGAGAQWGKSVNVGGGADAEAGGTIRTGDSWNFDSKKDADEFIGEIKKDAYSKAAEHTGVPVLAGPAFVYRHSPWRPKVPKPDVSRYSVEFGGKGSVDAGADTGSGKKHKAKSGGKHRVGKHRAGKHRAKDGSVRTDGRKGVNPDLAQGSGEVTFGQQETVEVDHEHHTYSATIDVHQSATANGDVAGKGPDHPVGEESDGAVKVTTDRHGNVIAVDMTQTKTVNGKTTVTTSHLPVTDANRTEVVKDLGLYGANPPLPTHLLWDDLAPTEDPGTAGNDFQREMYRHAQVTKVTYDTSSSSSDGDVEGKLGLEVGLGVEAETEDQRVTGAQYLGPPGPDGKRHYQPWKECTA